VIRQIGRTVAAQGRGKEPFALAQGGRRKRPAQLRMVLFVCG
jgi:hypothetical protein